MIGVELEEEFNDTIQRICGDDEVKKEEAKVYFDQYTVNDMIDEALRDW